MIAFTFLRTAPARADNRWDTICAHAQIDFGEVSGRRRAERSVLEAACRNCRILDAGTGNGALVRELRKRGFKAFGIDDLRKFAEWGRSPWFSKQDMGSTNFPDESFDLIYSVHGPLSYGLPLTTAEKTTQIFTEFRRLLKPKGIIRIYAADYTAVEIARSFPGLKIIESNVDYFVLQKAD
jgi:SAM-dependent methyltransferase